MDKPILSKQAFWGVDMDKIDYEKNVLYVLERVIDWGKEEDFMNIIAFYGRDRISKEIVNTKKLGDKEVNYCCCFYLKPSDFKNHKKGLLRSNLGYKNEFTDYYSYN